MHVLHLPDSPVLSATLLYLAENSIESPSPNMRVQIDTITLSCTADTLETDSVTFAKPFKSAPYILLFANPADPTTDPIPSHDKTKLTATGFQPQVYSPTTQDVDVTYIAVGSV